VTRAPARRGAGAGAKTGPRRPVRGAAACVLIATLAAGCGSPPPDLFVVTRSGPDPNANVRLIVSDGGSVTCNGREHPLDAQRLLTARRLARELEPQAELGLELPSGPGTQLSYRVRLEQGTIAFGDHSRHAPRAFSEVVAFTADVTERVCGIMR
jgi:hypothetical protein